jgi:hypothetical protein
MVDHLWAVHGLLLEGKRVREPWRIVEDWIDDYRNVPDPAVLQRARELAQRVDPARGVRRFHRMMLARELGDPDVCRTLLREADERQASLCPHCFEFVPLPRDISVARINTWRGRISGAGYSVQVDDSGLFSHLVIVSPAGTLVDAPEAGHVLTQKGRLYLIAGLPIYAALAAALLLPVRGIMPILPVCVCLGIGLLLWWFMRAETESAEWRSLHHAWRELVPGLLLEGTPTDALRFIAGLAELSLERRYFDVPRDLVRSAQAKVDRLLDQGRPAATLLASLQRYLLAGISPRRDPVPLLVEQIARSFRSELPFNYAQHLLMSPLPGCGGRLENLRLRVLSSRAAFENSFEVRNLLEACQVAPALEAVFQTGDVRYLATLRLLHSLLAQAPWENLGGAQTVFELAAHADESAVLLDVPDLLLVHEDRTIALLDPETRKPGPARIIMAASGIKFSTATLAAPPILMEVRGPTAMGVHEVRWDDHTFELTADPAALTTRLGHWVRFFAQDFRPQSSEVLRRQSSSPGLVVQPQHLVECPECHRRVFPRPGDVAAALEVGRLLD